jgi:hypothetical protein
MVRHGHIALPDLVYQQEQRVIARHDIRQLDLRELRGGDAEELLGGVVGETEAVLRVDHQHRHRQRAQHQGRVRKPRLVGDGAADDFQNAARDRIGHAASAMGMASCRRVTPQSISGS